MPFGSNFTLGTPAKLTPNVGDNPALDYQMGKDAGRLMAQRRVAKAMRDVTSDHSSMSNSQLEARLNELIVKRDELSAQLIETQAREQTEADQSTARREKVGDVVKKVGMGAGAVVAAPFYGIYKLIEKLAQKIKEGRATDEEITEYERLKAEAEAMGGQSGYGTGTGMEGYKPLFPDQSGTTTSRYDRSSGLQPAIGGDTFRANELEAPINPQEVNLFGTNQTATFRQNYSEPNEVLFAPKKKQLYRNI